MTRREFVLLLAGAMTARPLRAQQKAMPVIGYLVTGSPGPNAPFAAAFREGLRETGYVEGQNLAIEYRWAEGHYDRLPALATDLVARNVDVIAAGGDAAALAAKNASSTIPIVFFGGGDPVAMGLVTSFARPGGNLTGVAFMAAELMAKRLELLSELVPQARAIALLVNPNDPNAERFIGDVQEAARAKDLQLHILRASTESEIDGIFASLVELHAGALVVSPNAFFGSRREQLVTLASRHAVPAIYTSREDPTAGGLISYGASLTSVFRQLGSYAGKILKGAKPSDLPVQQPTRFELVVNLNTAKALGLTVPPSILARADEVIE
jgi:putative tryptophan/tyrosine transport system substrate-binding protein